MKIVIRWNNTYDNGQGHRTSVIESDKNKTSAELIAGWMTAHNRKLEELIIHDISVDGFAQKLAGKRSGSNMTPEQRSERARKAAAASAAVRSAKAKIANR